jgi:hypothetical protein
MYLIYVRKKDGYVNLNQLCKAGGKEFRKWKRLDKSQSFLRAMQEGVHQWSSTLIKYEPSGNDDRHM